MATNIKNDIPYISEDNWENWGDEPTKDITTTPSSGDSGSSGSSGGSGSGSSGSDEITTKWTKLTDENGGDNNVDLFSETYLCYEATSNGELKIEWTIGGTCYATLFDESDTIVDTFYNTSGKVTIAKSDVSTGDKFRMRVVYDSGELVNLASVVINVSIGSASSGDNTGGSSSGSDSGSTDSGSTSGGSSSESNTPSTPSTSSVILNPHKLYKGGDCFISNRVEYTEAYGGYIGDGLMYQFDCRDYSYEDGGWKDEITGLVAFDNSRISLESDGGIRFILGATTISIEVGEDVFTCYKNANGEFLSGRNTHIYDGYILYSIRVYERLLTDKEVDFNREKDIESFGTNT